MGVIIPSGSVGVKINNGFSVSVSENRYKKYGPPGADFIFTNGSIEDVVTTTQPITFTRNSPATYYDSSGILRTASVNEPRFNHDPLTGESLGLLIEESRTNYFEDSSYFNQDFWSVSGSNVDTQIIPNSAVAPDGTFTATKLVSGTGISSTSAIQTTNTVYGIAGEGTMQVSVFVKPAGYNFIAITGGNGSSQTIFDLSSLTSTSSGGAPGPSTGTIESYSNGWYRCTFKPYRYSSASLYTIYVTDNSSSTSFTGDGNSGIYIWGAQIEEKISFPTSYIPTTPTFTSRASTATYYDASGVVQTAAIDVARDDVYFPDENGVMTTAGLLLESAGTNLLPHSEQFGLYSPSEVDVLPNNDLAPDLSFTAGSIVETTATDYHQLFLYPIQATGNITLSGFIKNKQGTRNALLRFNDGTNDLGFYFNPSSGNTVGVLTGAGTTEPIDYGSQKLGNGWYRIYVTGNASSTGGSSSLYIIDNSTYSTHAGTGTDGFYVWGFQMEQNGYPTSYIETPATFSSRSQTNSDSASFYQSDGTIGYAATNVARDNAYLPDENGTFYPAGLLLEGEATNLMTYSEQFDTGWTRGGILAFGSGSTANATTAPDGTTTADLITEDISSGNHSVSQNCTFTSGVTYTFSGFFKRASGARDLLIIAGTIAFPGFPSITVSGATGEVLSSTDPNAKSEAFPGGWYRVSFSATADATGSSPIYFRISNSGSDNYTGDGTSGLYLWGAQLETGSYATSYIPTTSGISTRGRDFISSGITSTRSADVSSGVTSTRQGDTATISGVNYSNNFDPHPTGTVYCEYNREYDESTNSSTRRPWTFSRGTTNNNVQIRCDGSGNEGFYLVDGGTTSIVGVTTVASEGVFRKTACAWDNTTMSASFGNVGIATTTMNSSLPFNNSITEFSIGSYPSYSNTYLMGHVKRLTYWPTKLSDSELQRITQ